MRFRLKAYRDNDGVVALHYDADDLDEAIGKAERDGYRIITASTLSSQSWQLFGVRFPLVLFSQELLTLLEAGLPLLESIEALARKESTSGSGKVYNDIVKMLREGKSLSLTLESYPKAFPTLYVALVRASERTGDLPQALRRYLAYRQDMDVIRGKLTSAAIYPALLAIVGGLVVIFLLTYVVPRFSHMFEDIGGSLPWMSRLLMQWGQFLEANGGTFAITVAMGVILSGYVLSRKATQAWIAASILRIPVVGERARIYELSRFYRTLGMLLEGGIHIMKALEMTAGLLGQENLKAGLRSVTREVGEGKSVSSAMQDHGLTTEVAYQMLAVGEQSGNLGEMMERISRFYDAETARWMEWFTRLVEPILMLFIGLVIGGIVLLMYLPIFELAGSMQ